MGFGITELIIVLVIVILLFGTQKLRSLGGDLGGALKGFRNAMNGNEEQPQVAPGVDTDQALKADDKADSKTDKTPD